MYGKTPTFSGRCHFYSYFQNPSESSGYYYQIAIFLVLLLVLLCICIPIIIGKYFPPGLHRKNMKHYLYILFYEGIDLWLEYGDLYETRMQLVFS